MFPARTDQAGHLQMVIHLPSVRVEDRHQEQGADHDQLGDDGLQGAEGRGFGTEELWVQA